jgi:hypothetical protein
VAEASSEAGWAREAPNDWKLVDRSLRTIARRRAALDAEEARWLREAEEIQIWRPLGMVSMPDYMERVLGYGPRVAQERLRVARALADLPVLAAALTDGELAFSAIRELTRVATSSTEGAWRHAATGKSLRQIEDLVADHRPGDRPEDPPAPEARPRVVRFELSAETFALLRQAHAILDDEHGSHLSDDELVAALCSSVLDGEPTSEPSGRAKFQIAVTVCERCRQGWQDGAGARLAIGPAAIERASCDAQHVGSLDADVPERAHQDVSPSVARLVWRRDRGHCRVPGCRSARGLEIHHIVHRADGGTHDAPNLCLLCSACHQAHHAGALTIAGTAAGLKVTRNAESGLLGYRDTSAHQAANANAHVGANINAHVAANANADANANASADANAPTREPSTLTAAVLRVQAKEALVQLGWKPAIATTAVRATIAAIGANASLERLIFESLRRCAHTFEDRHSRSRSH